MSLFKNYKKLYRQQMENNKVLNEQKMDVSERYVEYQKNAIAKEKAYKERIAALMIELEDAKGFLEQERNCSKALRKERTKLKAKITRLSKEINKGE